MQLKQESIPFKILLLGASCVGKSILLQKYMEEREPDCYYPTLGVDQQLKSINFFNQIINLRIWDAGGDPHLHNIIKTYPSHADGALICFSVTNRNSFDSVSQYIQLVKQHKPHAPIILVGCKIDLSSQRCISAEEAQKKANEFDISYIETSSALQVNVNAVFEQLIEQLYLGLMLKKIKPILEKQFTPYAKTYEQLNSYGLFGDKSTNEGRLKNEYYTNLHQLFKAKNFSELKEFLQKTRTLINEADDIYQKENPILSIVTGSGLSKMLKQTLADLDEAANNISILSGLSGFMRFEKKTLSHNSDFSATV